MSSKKTVIRVSDEELELLKQLREKQVDLSTVTVPAVSEPAPVPDVAERIAVAIESAINKVKGPEKKTVFNRKKLTPWTDKDGKQLKLKRGILHHGLPVGTRVSNEEIELLNQIKPGYYCDGFVKVTLRKDRKLDIDYPIRTASHRLKLVNQFGIRNFAELLKRIVDEKANPTKYRRSEDLDLFEDN